MATTSAAEQVNPFGAVTEMLEHFRLPGFDMAAIVESRRKDRGAWVAANQATLESMQTMSKKAAEILSKAIQGVQDAAESLTQSGAGTPAAAKYAELARKAYDKALSDMMELAEMGARPRPISWRASASGQPNACRRSRL